jgi:hypothetical protein
MGIGRHVIMRILKTMIPALLALALLAGSASVTAAQESGPLQMEDIAGLETVYARSFSDDVPATAEPGATPTAMPGGWYVLAMLVMEFDTEDNAAAGLDLVMTEFTRSAFGGDDAQMDNAELDLSFDHVARRAVIESGGLTNSTADVLMAAARDETTVLLVVGMTFGEDPEPVVTSTLTTMVETDSSDAPETFAADGTSEGGLWARFPSAERVQSELPALKHADDEMLFPTRVPAISTPIRIERPVQTVGTPAG